MKVKFGDKQADLWPESCVRYRVAVEKDRKAVEYVAKLSPFTKDFANPPLSLKAMCAVAFKQDEVYVAEVYDGEKWQMRGFIWSRPMKPKHMPFSTVYYMGVFSSEQLRGLGKQLLRLALDRAKEGRIELVCERGNEGAYSFYKKLNGQPIAEGTVGKDNRPYTRFAFVRGQKGL